jgi:maltose alpha-D-glucosyltransferase/alpha-amylase
MNHTSDQHPWFQAARRDARSRYRDYYVWTDSPPPTPPDEGTILEENTVWTYDEIAGAYYYHRFYHFEPGLKFANPEVQEEMQRVLDFWLCFEVAGFRVDAASHMIHKKGIDSAEPGNPHGILKDLRRYVNDRREGSVLIGEADVRPSELADYIGEGDELNMIFNFLLNNYTFLALAREQAEPIARGLSLLPTVPQEGQWANFLRNLDEVDLERLTEDERQEVYQAFGPKPEMQIFGRGIRRRVAPMLRDRRQLEMAWSLLFSLPGTPMLVYGDEIGMGDDLSQDGRNSVRTSMQWSDAKNAGFSEAPAKALRRPVISEGTFSYRKVNVAAQQDDSDSLLSHMKQLIAARRQAREVGWGSCEVIGTDQPSVFAHWCKYQRDAVLAVHNLSRKPCTATLDLEQDDRHLTRIHGNTEPESPKQGAFRFHLPEYGHGWFRIHGT